MKYLTLPESVPETFWDRVEVTGACWNWLGALNRNGYGAVKLSGKMYLVHRVSYGVLVGEIGPQQLDHVCRNRRCLNPDHLEAVTQRVNILRGFSAAARQARQTECIHGHAFDSTNTYWYSEGRRRACRTCKGLTLLPVAP